MWLRDLDRGLEVPFTFDGAVPIWRNVVWSPDGSRIAFPSAATGSLAIRIGDVSSPGTDELLIESENPKNPTDWSSAGYLVYTEIDPETGADIWYVPVNESGTTGSETIAFRQDPFHTSFGQISPDGRWIAYVSNESGGSEVWVQPFPSGAGRWRISGAESETGTTQQPRWIRGGSELAYLTGAGRKSTVMVASVATPTSPGASPVGDPRPLFEVRVNSYAPHYGTFFCDVTDDGERFLINEVDSDAEPVMHVVLNWETLLEGGR